MGCEVPVIGRHVGEKHRGQCRPVVQHRSVEQGLEHAAAAARGGNHIDARTLGAVGGVVHVPYVGEHFAAFHVHDDDGHVVDLITPVTLVVAPGKVVDSALQVVVERRAERPLAHFAQQVHRLHRHRFGGVGQMQRSSRRVASTISTNFSRNVRGFPPRLRRMVCMVSVLAPLVIRPAARFCRTARPSASGSTPKWR